jgi:membrane protein implicated in regulation of membrane protease activity
MVVGAGVAGALGLLGIPLQEQLLLSLILCVFSASLARKLHRVEALRGPDELAFRQ